jgi:hypothetical protein
MAAKVIPATYGSLARRNIAITLMTWTILMKECQVLRPASGYSLSALEFPVRFWTP